VNIKLSETEVIELKKLLSSKEIFSAKDINFDVINNINERLKKYNSIELFVDGAANLNTERAGIGGIIYKNNNEITNFSLYIGKATNNEAEYKALIMGIKEILNLNYSNVSIYADSELVVKQVNGIYKVKNVRMQKLYRKVMSLLNKLDRWTITHIPREQNYVADTLSKEGMTNK
jgi:ribonuclease HI